MTGTVPAEITLLGFTRVEDFQRAWNLGPRLTPDGIPGPVTMAAARLSAGRHHAGLPDLSANFSAAEATCHCGGRFAGCHRVLVLRELLQALEALRARHGGPISLQDIYRCPQYNATIPGSASDSQHCYGTAADPVATLGLTTKFVRSLHVFSGIGSGARTGIVLHVDVRAAGPHNVTNSTVSVHAVWTYPGE